MDIDTHQHFWHYPPRKHTWMSADMPGLKRDHLPADLEPVLAANGIGGYGGGTYPGGSRVDIFAATPPTGQVFDRWNGDTAAPDSARMQSPAATSHRLICAST